MDYEAQYKALLPEYTRLSQLAKQYQEDHEIAETLRNNSDYLAAVKAVDDGQWGQTSASRPAQFSQPQGQEEPAYVKALREELNTFRDEFGRFRQMTEEEQIAAARKEIDSAEAVFRGKFKNVPDDVYAKINQRIADTGLSFDDCARIEAFDYMAPGQKEAEAAPAPPSTFAPMGGASPPTGPTQAPRNAEEAIEAAKSRFISQTGGVR